MTMRTLMGIARFARNDGDAAYPLGSNCSASVTQYDAPTGRISSLKSYRGWWTIASSLPRPPPSMM